MHTGRSTNIENCERVGISRSVVMTLLKPYLRKGHNVFVDNWYTSPTLFRMLHEKRTGSCGTVRATRKEMPIFTKKMKPGDKESQHSSEILAMRWHDKRDVIMLTTIHKDKMRD